MVWTAPGKPTGYIRVGDLAKPPLRISWLRTGYLQLRPGERRAASPARPQSDPDRCGGPRPFQPRPRHGRSPPGRRRTRTRPAWRAAAPRRAGRSLAGLPQPDLAGDHQRVEEAVPAVTVGSPCPTSSSSAVRTRASRARRTTLIIGDGACRRTHGPEVRLPRPGCRRPGAGRRRGAARTRPPRAHRRPNRRTGGGGATPTSSPASSLRAIRSGEFGTASPRVRPLANARSSAAWS